MCETGEPHHHDAFGYLVDTAEIRALIEETRRLTLKIADTAARVEALEPAFAKLLGAEGWLPPTDDIHYVRTISEDASISIHLLANDTACVWRHRFEPDTGHVTPFRSGYANAPCPEDAGRDQRQ